jgi:excisionase family DNA binding protein
VTLRSIERTTPGPGRNRTEISRQTPLDALPQFLTVEELCAYLAIGRSCAYELVRTGQIASARFGRLVRIPKSVLVGLIQVKPGHPNGRSAP